MKVAVIGGGHIGASVALMFARAGYETGIYNRSANGRATALAWMQNALQILIGLALETEAGAEAALARIAPGEEIEAAAAEAGYVFEAVAEDLELKKQVFARLDSACPAPAILASGTSGLRIGDIAAATAHPERVIGVHHFTPPHIVPGVEVVAGPATSAETVRHTMHLLKVLGRRPVLSPDVPGFIANRLSSALRREAWAIVEAQLASAADVDEIWKGSLGPIYAALGPLTVCDASGMDVLLAVHEYVEPVLWPPSSPSAMVRAMRDRGDLGLKSGRGFHDWPPERAAELHRLRDAFLLRIFESGASEPV